MSSVVSHVNQSVDTLQKRVVEHFSDRTLPVSFLWKMGTKCCVDQRNECTVCKSFGPRGPAILSRGAPFRSYVFFYAYLDVMNFISIAKT